MGPQGCFPYGGGGGGTDVGPIGPGPCASNPCAHGTCIPNGINFLCTCLQGYTGTLLVKGTAGHPQWTFSDFHDFFQGLRVPFHSIHASAAPVRTVGLAARPLMDSSATVPTISRVYDAKGRKNVSYIPNLRWFKLIRELSSTYSSSACGGTITGVEGTLRYPHDSSQNYRHNANCMWTLRSELGKVLNLTFTRFHLEGGGAVCGYDWLQVGTNLEINSTSVGKGFKILSLISF